MQRIVSLLKQPVILAILIPLLSLIFALGGASANNKNVERRVEQLEQKTVTRDEMKMVNGRLDRIENKVDQVLLNQSKEKR